MKGLSYAARHTGVQLTGGQELAKAQAHSVKPGSTECAAAFVGSPHGSLAGGGDGPAGLRGHWSMSLSEEGPVAVGAESVSLPPQRNIRQQARRAALDHQPVGQGSLPRWPECRRPATVTGTVRVTDQGPWVQLARMPTMLPGRYQCRLSGLGQPRQKRSRRSRSSCNRAVFERRRVRSP